MEASNQISISQNIENDIQKSRRSTVAGVYRRKRSVL